MFYVNSRLGKGSDGGNPPRLWPLNTLTQKFCPDGPRTTLVGNPAVWALNLLLLLLFPLFAVARLARRARPPGPLDPVPLGRTTTTGLELLALWGIHYFPFFLMGRTLYLHHYYPGTVLARLHCCTVPLPAAYFSCLLTGVLVERAGRALPCLAWLPPVAVLATIAATFIHFSPGTFLFCSPLL